MEEGVEGRTPRLESPINEIPRHRLECTPQIPPGGIRTDGQLRSSGDGLISTW